MKIKKGDQVRIIAGKDKGKAGKVLRTFQGEKKMTVEGLHLVTKHIRPRREGEKGQRVKIPAKLDVSNAVLICPKCGKPARVYYKQAEGGSKLRICKKCQAEI